MKRRVFRIIPILLLGAAGLAAAQTTFKVEGAVIDSRNGNSLGVVTERGELASLFRAQKAVTFGILRSAGISLDQLSPEVRARIERFQTTNVEAFRAFSQGLDLKDQGKFGDAREFFRRAAELDPGFALAVEQQQSMPDVNLSTGLQMRAVIAAATGAAVERGKTAYAVDAARAVAALQAGQQLVLLPPDSTKTRAETDSDTSSNPAGSSTQFAANQSVGLIYNFANSAGQSIGLIASTEWSAGNVRLSGNTLDAVGNVASGFLASRVNASVANAGSFTLADGTPTYWGSWISTTANSAAITNTSSGTLRAPTLGQVDWMVAESPRAMPTSGSGSFTPRGGLMNNVSGNIQVDFLQRSVALQNLGFQIGSLSFSALNGSATYAQNTASGAFSGNYTSGLCSGCAAFNPVSSVFSGNFAGSQANGLIFSTIMLTGNGTAAGTHLFTRP